MPKTLAASACVYKRSDHQSAGDGNLALTLLTETTCLHVVHPRTQQNGRCRRDQRGDEQDAADPDIFLGARDAGDGDGCEDKHPDDELGVSNSAFHCGVSLRDDEESEDGECCEEPDDGVDPCELDEPLIGFAELFAQELDFLLMGISATVHLVRVDDELSDCFLVVLLYAVRQRVDVALLGVNGYLLLGELLEDRERWFNLCYLAFGFDDALHAVADVPAYVLHVLGDGSFEVCKVGGEGFVVVDDCLECGVAVCPSGGAVALSLGGCGCHGVSFLVGVWSVVRIVGMDFSTLFSGGSAFAAIVSAFFAAVSWYQSIGSKKAKAKAEEAHRAALEMRDAAVRSAKAAEERAQQAEEALKQVEQLAAESQKQSKSQADIASHTWRPTFELTWTRGDTFLLRNVTGESVEVVEVANLDDFVRCPQIQQVFSPGEALRVLMLGVFRKPLPSNLKLRIRIDGVDEVISVPIRR